MAVLAASTRDPDHLGTAISVEIGTAGIENRGLGPSGTTVHQRNGESTHQDQCKASHHATITRIEQAGYATFVMLNYSQHRMDPELSWILRIH